MRGQEQPVIQRIELPNLEPYVSSMRKDTFRGIGYLGIAMATFAAPFIGIPIGFAQHADDELTHEPLGQSGRSNGDSPSHAKKAPLKVADQELAERLFTWFENQYLPRTPHIVRYEYVEIDSDVLAEQVRLTLSDTFVSTDPIRFRLFENVTVDLYPTRTRYGSAVSITSKGDAIDGDGNLGDGRVSITHFGEVEAVFRFDKVFYLIQPTPEIPFHVLSELDAVELGNRFRLE